MKTLLKFAATACLSLALVSLTQAEEHMSKKDHIMMKDGKMMVQKDGKVTMLEGQMSLENGTTVKPDGTVTMKDGEMMVLKNGDAIDMMGMKMKHHMKKGEGDAGTNAGTNGVTNTKTSGAQPTGKAGGEAKAGTGEPNNKDTNNVTNTKTSGGAPK